MGLTYNIFLLIVFIFLLSKNKINRNYLLVILMIMSIFLVFIYQLLLLNNNKISYGSDAEHYYQVGKNYSLIEIVKNNPISTNVGYPVINSLFFFTSNNDIFNMFLIKISNVFIVFIGLALICKCLHSINWILILLPGYTYIFTKNFREPYIILAIVLFLIAYFFEENRHFYFLLSFALLLLFRDFFMVLFFYVFLYIRFSKKVVRKQTFFFLKNFFLFLIISLLIIFIFFQFDNTRYTLQGFAMLTGSDYEARAHNPLVLTFSEAAELNYFEYTKWIAQVFINQSPPFIFEPSPYNYIDYAFKNSTESKFDILNHFIISVINYLFIFPFLVNQTVIIYKKGKNIDVDILNDLLFVVLLTLSIVFSYVVGLFGMSNYRTKFLVVVTYFFGIQLIRSKYNIEELMFKRQLVITLIFNIIAFTILFL